MGIGLTNYHPGPGRHSGLMHLLRKVAGYKNRRRGVMTDCVV